MPPSKYRWISYFSIFQMSVLSFNLFFLATPKLIEERDEAIKNKYRKRQIKQEEIGTETEIQQWELNPDYNPDTLWQRMKKSFSKDIFTWKNIKNNAMERPLTCAGLLGSSGLVFAAFGFYAHRMVHRIILLPNERVRFQFFNALPLGKPNTLELNLSDISCNAGRKSNFNYSTLRLRDRWGYFLVHKSEGEFLEPKLYDKYLGYERSWAVRST